jgi:hypothetical protein
MDKRELLQMAMILKIDREIVFWHCCRLWLWSNRHLTNGTPLGPEEVDLLLNCPGFSNALQAVGWGIHVPKA